MARKRKSRGKELKAKVALAAVSGVPASQLVSRFGVHATQVAAWKKQLVERADELFTDGRRRESSEVNEQELYEQIGRLQMELAWLKKKVAQVQ
jgi:putative transposase